MIKYLLPLIIVFVAIVQAQEQARPSSETIQSSAATGIVGVRIELEAMLETDQLHRRELSELDKKYGSDSAEVKEAWAKQHPIDAQNIRRLEEIIAEYGWPGSSQFGMKASMAAFLILQHSDISYQKKCLPIAKAAAAKGEMRASSLALLEDRVRLREGQKQLYGSQVTRNGAGEWEPLPLEDEEKVDTLRASVGLGSISEYLQGFAEQSGGCVNPKWTKKKKEPNQTPEATPVPATSAVNPPVAPTNGAANLTTSVTKPMKSDPIDVAKAFIAAINRHSVSELGALMSEDHTFIDSLGRKVVGREAMVTGWTAYFAMFPDFEISTENFLADGDTVAIFGRSSGTFNGKRGPVPESRIAMPAAWRAIVADGKIKLWQVYTDWSEGVKTVERER